MGLAVASCARTNKIIAFGYWTTRTLLLVMWGLFSLSTSTRKSVGRACSYCCEAAASSPGRRATFVPTMGCSAGTLSSSFSSSSSLSAGARSSRTAMTATQAPSSPSSSSPPQSVAVVGGGLAGLAATYHLLDLRRQELQEQSDQGRRRVVPLHVTVMDRQPVGTGGASAVAGGLLHPLTPRGTLVRDGLQGLRCTEALIRAAEIAWERAGAATDHREREGRDDSDSSHAITTGAARVVIRNELYRIASNEQQAQILKDTASTSAMSSMAEWIPSYGGTPHGALRLHSGCQVVHVPTYLKALWAACEDLCASTANYGTMDAPLSVRWETAVVDDGELNGALQGYDAVILAAGSGMFVNPDGSTALPILGDRHGLPVQLVRGQSVELVLPPTSAAFGVDDAILCGKYVSPLPPGTNEGRRAVLVGATHEYQPIPLSPTEVVEELRARTAPFLPTQRDATIWEDGTVRRFTSGVRVQSARGKLGRRPIIGRWDDSSLHPSVWIFTGLSSRGLLYHAMYGKMIAGAALNNSEDRLRDEYPDALWWKSSITPYLQQSTSTTRT